MSSTMITNSESSPSDEASHQQEVPWEPVNILLVDDEPRNLDVLESILSSPHYKLLRAENADDALRLLIKNEIAVIVLDVQMPAMNGIELAQIIKQRKKSQDIPIIFLTAYYQEDEHKLQGYGVGAVDYLTKPTNPVILKSKVEAFVDLHRTTHRLQSEVMQRRKAEESLQQMADRLRALASELSQAEQRERKRLADLLHDHLQQMLVGALMRLQQAERSKVDNLRNSVKVAGAILKEAIEVSRSLTIELSPPVLSESGLIAALKWLAERYERQFQTRILVHVDEQCEPGLQSTRLFLFDCARELLFNAIKHSKASVIKLNAVRNTAGRHEISVEDNGCGFDKLKVEQSGKGFGLFSIQQRLAFLNGDLDIESTAASGTKAVIRIPPDNPVAAPKISLFPSAPDLSRSGEKSKNGGIINIVLADDHKIVRQGLKGLLEFEPDMKVIGEAGNGHEAVKLAFELKPDLVVTDISMPGMSGIEVAKIISRDMPSVKVIGLSMHVDPQVEQEMRKAGAVAYMAKGGPAEDLIATIRACC